MLNINTADDIGDQALRAEQAVAVLIEVMHYFERKIEPDTTEAYLLARQSAHISTLLNVAYLLLIDIAPRLRGITNTRSVYHEQQG